MEKKQAYELAKEIIHLDLLRDQKWCRRSRCLTGDFSPTMA